MLSELESQLGCNIFIQFEKKSLLVLRYRRSPTIDVGWKKTPLAPLSVNEQGSFFRFLFWERKIGDSGFMVIKWIVYATLRREKIASREHWERIKEPLILYSHTQDQFIPIFSIVEQNIVCFINVPYPGKQLHNYILFDIIRPKLYGRAVDAWGAYYREKPGNLCTRIEFLAAGTALFSSVQTFSKRAELF